MICLDSDFIIDLLKQKPDAVLKLKSLRGETLVSTEVNYFEILYGIFKKHILSQKELDLIQEFFDALRTITFDHISAYNAAKISSDLEKEDMIIGFNDSLIAGICVYNNCSILTKNVKHFLRIKELKVETY